MNSKCFPRGRNEQDNLLTIHEWVRNYNIKRDSIKMTSYVLIVMKVTEYAFSLYTQHNLAQRKR